MRALIKSGGIKFGSKMPLQIKEILFVSFKNIYLNMNY
jgi:hypothetical protein